MAPDVEKNTLCNLKKRKLQLLYYLYNIIDIYQNPIKNHEKIGLEKREDLKHFTKYSNDMQDVYQRIEEYNPNRTY